jgi:alkylated DNA repair dioxygenase AlkB
MTQASLFPDEPIAPSAPVAVIEPSPSMPAGFHYRADLIGVRDEAALLETIAGLTFTPYEFRGFQANRKVAAFGYLYSYNTRRMETARELPPWLKDLRIEIAAFAGLRPDAFEQVLVTEYVPGTALGWHRDRLQYGEIVGVSLHSPANFRMRRRDGSRWLRANRIVEPRSVYKMSGESRLDWEHSIPAVETLRYSLTFRTFTEAFIAARERAAHRA